MEIPQCTDDATLMLVLVAYKLWSVERQLYRVKKDRYLTKVAVTIVESGALYSAFLVVLLATYLKGDWSLFIPFFLVRENVLITGSHFLTCTFLVSAVHIATASYCKYIPYYVGCFICLLIWTNLGSCFFIGHDSNWTRNLHR